MNHKLMLETTSQIGDCLLSRNFMPGDEIQIRAWRLSLSDEGSLVMWDYDKNQWYLVKDNPNWEDWIDNIYPAISILLGVHYPQLPLSHLK